MDCPPPSGFSSLPDRDCPAGVAASAMRVGAGFLKMDDDMDYGSDTVRTKGALHAVGLWHNDLNSLGAAVKETREHGPRGHAKSLGTD